MHLTMMLQTRLWVVLLNVLMVTTVQAQLIKLDDSIEKTNLQWVGYGNEDQFTRSNKSIVFTADGQMTNSHIDFTIKLKAHTHYVLGVTIKNLGANLVPTLRLADARWMTLRMLSNDQANSTRQCSELLTFDQDMTIRVQFFGYRVTDLGPVVPSGKAVFTEFHIRQLSPAELKKQLSASIQIDPSKPLSKTSPLFKGGNSLYWIDTPDVYQQADYAQYLTKMGVTLMRFPAGEAADDYDWRVANGNVPFEPSQTAALADVPIATQIQFDQFMQWAKRLGIEPVVVVNLETSLANGNIEQGIELACNWVRYSNMTKGYNVRYWEIGNESYLRGGHYPLSAPEYARAFRQFAIAMKKVDPTIKVGANGPNRVYALGQLDRLSEDLFTAFRKLSRSDRKKPAIMRKFMAGSEEKNDPALAWWPIVCRMASDQIDFAVIHHYVSSSERGGFTDLGTNALDMQRHFSELRHYLAKQARRDIPLALTEWNVGRNIPSITPFQAALTNVELAFNALNAGVEMSCFWPIRWPTERWDDLAMFSTQGDPRPSYHALKMLYARLGDRTLACKVQGSGEVYAAATGDADKAVVDCFVINRCGLAEPIDVTLPRLGSGQVTAQCWTESAVQQWQVIEVAKDKKHLRVSMPARSIVVIRYQDVDLSGH